jgi:hypothetical protein
MTFREFQEKVCASVAAIAAGFTAPDDDWATVAMLVDDRDEITVVLLPEDPAEQTAMILTGVRDLPARKVAIVASAWSRPHPQAAETAEGRAAAAAIFSSSASSHSGAARIETALVFVLDEERCETWLAPIRRDGKHPPSLGHWRNGGEPVAPWLEQMRQALR